MPSTPPPPPILLPTPKYKGKGPLNKGKGKGKGLGKGGNSESAAPKAAPSKSQGLVVSPPKPTAKALGKGPLVDHFPKYRTRWHPSMGVTSKYPPTVSLLPPSGIPREVTEFVGNQWLAPPVANPATARSLLRPKAEVRRPVHIRRSASRSHTSESSSSYTSSS